MTAQELMKLSNIENQIAFLDGKIRELKERAYGVKAQNMDGMPRNSGIGRKVEDIGIEIAGLEMARDDLMVEQRRLVAYINAIPDDYTRRIFDLRYRQGCTWLMVAMKIGGGNLPDGVRKTAERYLLSQNGEEEHKRGNDPCADTGPDRKDNSGRTW